MKLVSYLDGSARFGVVRNGHVADISACTQHAPKDINAFIEWVSADGHRLEGVAKAAAEAPQIPIETVRLLPCIPRPGKIICLGLNYKDHAAEGGNKVEDYPALFLRCATSLVAHGASIFLSPHSTCLDYEAELAVVIGRYAREVSEVEALNSVFGYACFNDATYRDYQKRTTQWTIGKNFDLTGGFGPFIVTADELPLGASGLHIESRLNGKVMQSANTEDLIFPVARTIELLSQSVTLEPGDVILMGTPAGVGYARKPPVWMRQGDVIEVEIEKVGTLRNTVASER